VFCPRCFSVDDDLVLTSSAAFVTFADHALRLMPSGISLISQFRHTNDNETHQLLVKRVNLHTYFPFECKAFNVQFLFVLFYFTGTRFNVCGSCCWSGLWTGPWWPSLWRCTPCGEPKKNKKWQAQRKMGGVRKRALPHRCLIFWIILRLLRGATHVLNTGQMV